MRLAVYHPWVYLKSGIERLLLEVFERSRHEWTLYTHHHEPEATYPDLGRHPVVELEPRVSVRRSLGPLLHVTRTLATARLPDDGARALLVSSEGLGDLVVLRSRLPAAAYCHTPLKIVHDPVARSNLTSEARVKALASRALGPAFSTVDRLAWRRYRHVFANSEETRRRILAAGLRPAGPIEVLHPGVDIDRFARPGIPRRPLFLVAGRIMWQKRLELALDAFDLAQRRGLDADLVVAGFVDEKSRPYLARLHDRAATIPRVTFEVDPDDDRLAELYNAATALVFTPPNEDFGMVPLEAMGCGTPVLAVAAGGPLESIIDGVTGWLRPPEPAAFAEVLLDAAAAGDRLEPMRQAARRRAAEFTWERTVGRLDDVMAAVAEGVSPSDPG